MAFETDRGSGFLPRAPREETPVAELLREALGETRDLVQIEVALAREELQQRVLGRQGQRVRLRRGGRPRARGLRDVRGRHGHGVESRMGWGARRRRDSARRRRVARPHRMEGDAQEAHGGDQGEAPGRREAAEGAHRMSQNGHRNGKLREELLRQSDDTRNKLVRTVARIDQRRHDVLDVRKQSSAT